MENKKFLLPIGFKGVIGTHHNTQSKHNVSRGDEFIITEYANSFWFEYEVKFLDKKHEKLNKKRPFIKNSDIELSSTAKVLFGDYNETKNT